MTREELLKINPNMDYHPPEFDHEAAELKARAFAKELRSFIDDPFVLAGSQIQDATFHASISFNGGLVIFSNFENLVTITSPETLEPQVFKRVRDLIENFGYTFIDFNVFDRKQGDLFLYNGQLFSQLFDFR